MDNPYTIPQWCDRYGFCRQTFYNLRRAGKAPRIMKINKNVRITPEADREWQLEREADAAAAVSGE